MVLTKMFLWCAHGALILGMSCAAAQAELITRVCYLTGTQEVPPNASTATGCGVFVFDTDANTCAYRIVYQGFADVAAHVHGFAPPIDFNNDGVAPDTDDIDAFLRVFAGGPC